MAGKKSTKTEANRGSEPRYTLAELTAHAKERFSVRPEVIAGAMYGAAGELFTVAEVQEQIKHFMKAKVD